MAKGTYEFIASATPAGTTTATFSSIPQTYTDLVLFISAGTTASGAAYAGISVKFNGDSSTSYGATTMYNFQGNWTPQSGGGPSSEFGPRASVPDGAGLTTAQIDILNYSSTTTSKPFIIRSGQGDWEALMYDAQQGVWLNTNGITSMTLQVSGPSYRANSYIALYGIKGE